MSKKVQAFIFIGLVIVAVFIAFNPLKKQLPLEVKKENVNEKKEPFAKEPLTFVDPEKLPVSFPENFPIEANAEILQNYNNETTGSLQATRRFISAKTLKQNFDFYNKYLKDNGWEILATLNQAEVKSIAAVKDGVNLAASFTLNSQKESIIDLSFNIKK